MSQLMKIPGRGVTYRSVSIHSEMLNTHTLLVNNKIYSSRMSSQSIWCIKKKRVYMTRAQSDTILLKSKKTWNDSLASWFGGVSCMMWNTCVLLCRRCESRKICINDLHNFVSFIVVDYKFSIISFE